ncbi:MAG: DUF4148 domain-containing protein [Pseudomonadota bacterium]
MKASRLAASTLVALATLAAGSAFADSGVSFPEQAPSTTSSLTRAEVQAEVLQARRDGTLDQQFENHNYPTVTAQSAPSGKTRAEVQAEYRAARQAGLIPQYRS